MISTTRLRRLPSLLIAFLLIALCASLTRAQLDAHGRWENGVSEPWWFAEETTAQDEIRLAQLRWKEIGDDNSSAKGHAWAGDFFVGGETSGLYLRWSAKSGFVAMSVNKCSAYVRSFSYGQVKLTPTSVEFHTEKTVKPASLDKHTPHELPTKFLPVKWRGVNYLISEKEMDDFGDYVAGFGNYNTGIAGYALDGASFFYQLGVEETGSPDEAPSVPQGYERFIKKPINAKIIAVGIRTIKLRQNEPGDEPYYESETPVTIDAGKAEGVKPQMSFVVLSTGVFEEVKIRRVKEHSSTGVIIRLLTEDEKTPPVLLKDDESMSYSPVTVGWEISTSLFKFAQAQSSN